MATRKVQALQAAAKNKMASSRLDHPARKMFIRQLTVDGVSSYLQPSDNVWLQGVFVEVNESADEAVLDDGSGTSRVDVACVKKLRGGDGNFVAVGAYVMVVGRVVSLAPSPLVRGIKVSPISGSEVCEVLWGMEVVHQQQHMSGNQGGRNGGD